MKKRYELLVFLSFFVLFLLVLFYSEPAKITTILGAGAGFWLGSNILVGYLSKRKFDVGWITVRYENNPIERFFYLIGGFACVALGIYGLFSGW